MGTLVRFRQGPNGQMMTPAQYDQFMPGYNAAQAFAQNRGQPIPGFTGPAGTGAGIPGYQRPMMQRPPMRSSGPNGLLAMMLGGRGGAPSQPPPQWTNPSAPQMPTGWSGPTALPQPEAAPMTPPPAAQAPTFGTMGNWQVQPLNTMYY